VTSDSDRSRTATWSAAPEPGTGAPDLPARWRPVRPLGRGGQAEVWLVEDLEVGALVAFKLLPPATPPAVRERLRREVRVGRSLQHPALVRVFDLHEVGDRAGVAMEYLPGGSLAERLNGGPLTVDETVALARRALEALAFLHQNGVVHRDVKPSNLLFDADGSARLADLGLVRALDETSDLTAADAALGTPAYMSPEQRCGGVAGPPADLFGLGLTLVEALTGARPAARQRAVGALPAETPRWLRRFLFRLLEDRPEDRWPDGGAALQAFEARKGLASPRGRRRLALGVLAGAGVLAGVAALVALRGPDLDGASARVDGSTLTLYDRSGQKLWENDLGGRARAVLTADLVGGREPEVAVAVQPEGEGASDTVALGVYSGRGEPVTRVEREGGAFLGQWPGMSSSVGQWKLFELEVEPGSGPWLGWTVYHPTWYPCAFGLWDVRRGIGPWTLLRNAGHLHTVTAADLDGEPPAELVLTGINNPLGYQSAVVIMRPSQRHGLGLLSLSSPDDLLSLREERLEGLASDERPVYTLLGSSGVLSRVVAAGRDGLTLAVGAETVRLDVWGNPAGGPLDGAGPLPRQRFWDTLRDLCLRIEEGTVADGAFAAFERENADVLAEEPHRVAADLMLSRSLARSGRHVASVELLDVALARSPEVTDVKLRLGEQLVIVGDTARGVAVLLDSSSDSAPGRMSLDALFALAHVAAVTADGALLGRVETRLGSYFPSLDDPNRRVVPALAAFARGHFEDPDLDTGVRPHLLPEVEVLRSWARLERGSPPAEIAAVAEAMAGDPEKAPLAGLLLARALTQDGQAARARGVAEAALAELERRARTEVGPFVWRGLGERVLADACRAAGDAACAEAHSRRAAELAPRAWFGAGGGARRSPSSGSPAAAVRS